jgi:hypothetical protein
MRKFTIITFSIVTVALVLFGLQFAFQEPWLGLGALAVGLCGLVYVGLKGS